MNGQKGFLRAAGFALAAVGVLHGCTGHSQDGAQGASVEQPAEGLNAGPSTHRGGAPALVIEKPANGTKVNVAGGRGYLADADKTTPACDAEFWVACLELGQPVQLRYGGSQSGKVFASGTCKARVLGDPQITHGFRGRAKIKTPFDTSMPNVAIVATENVSASRTRTLTGYSDPLTLHGDCTAPSPAFAGDPCGSANGNVLNLTSATFHEDVTVVDNAAADTVTATLGVSNSDGTQSSTSLPASTSGSYLFSNVNLGGAGSVTLTATLVDDFANSATKSCTTSIARSDVPSVSVSAPTDGQSFAPGASTCDAGSGNFGVQLSAMADSMTNRSASASVNGATAQALTVGSAGAISGCLAVPDDAENGGNPSTIVVHVESSVSHSFVEQSVHVSVQKLAISLQTNANGAVDPQNNCVVGGGFGVNVSSQFDGSLIGRSYSIDVSGNTVVSSQSITQAQHVDCVALAPGPNAVTVKIDGTNIARSGSALDLSQGPTMAVTLSDPTLPAASSATYRSDSVTANWPKPTSDFPGQLVSYELRCRSVALDASVAASQKDNWWAIAQPVALPSGLDPNASGATQSAALHFRIGETNHCVLRAKDGLGQLTPITGSKDLSLPFRQAPLAPGVSGTFVGESVAGVGDVNGDAFDDVLIGGFGQVALVFGSAGTPSGTPNVIFHGAAGLLGSSIAGIGDFNGDGINDFALGEATWNNQVGRVYVFFGRPSGSAWPVSVDLSAQAPGSCGADLCIDHGVAGSLFGWAVSSAGNFDANGSHDLAIGALGALGGSGDPSQPGQAFVVLGSSYQANACASDADCRASETCSANACTLRAGQAFWGIEVLATDGSVRNPEPNASSSLLRGFKMDGDPSSMLGLGGEFAALGAQDSAAGDDLAVAALGDSNAATRGKVFFLSGRAYTGSGMQDIASSQLGINADGKPFATAADFSGANDLFGNVVSALGNIYNVSGGTRPGAGDIGIERALDNGFLIFPGDNDLSITDMITLTSPQHNNIGSSIANGVFPAIASISSDLDGDGRPELCAGAAFSNNTTPGDVWLWYADTIASNVASFVLQDSSGSRTVVPGIDDASGGSDIRMVDFAGDINGDGFPDIVVGDPDSGLSASFNGGAILLY